MKHLVLPCSVFLVLAGTAVLRAATPLPPWYLEPDTTREGYQFTSGSLNPLPEIDENPNGTPAAEVVVGEFSDGWQNPAVPWASHGLIGDGAWDLGVAGTFSVLSKIAADPPTPDSVFRVDFLIYVAYLYDSNIIVAPELDIVGQSPLDLAYTDVALGTVSNRTYRGRTWTGYLENVTTNQIEWVASTPTVTSGTEPTAVLDTVEIFTKVTVVPEPSSCLLLALSSFICLLCRRRS
jgi:hypothetical protein